MTGVFSIDQCKIFDELLKNIVETYDDQFYIEHNEYLMSTCADDPLVILMTEKYKKCNDDYRLNLIKSFANLYGLNLKFIPNFIY